MPDNHIRRACDLGSEITDSSLFRLQSMVKPSWSALDADLIEPLLLVSFDHLAFADEHFLGTFSEQVSQELLPTAQAFPVLSPSAVQSLVSIVEDKTSFRDSTRDMYRGSLSLLSEADAEVLARYEVSVNHVYNQIEPKANLIYHKIVHTSDEQFHAVVHCLKIASSYLAPSHRGIVHRPGSCASLTSTAQGAERRSIRG